MQTLSIKKPNFHLSDKTRVIITDVITYLFIVLFMYTAASKFFSVKSFSSTLAKSPLIGSFNVIVAWAIPIIEVAISILLIITSKRKLGLYASLSLMIIFTAYLLYMVFSGSKLPCNCGGVISTMTWQQHIWFNLGFVVLAIAGLILIKKEIKNKS